jgi:diaminohydroxyphosphoribosylaminopyrimidine deaminase/5-amino-6-(5-phosphoribosylamino)uracil reductase
MKIAIKLALKAEGMTSPNPVVGSVVVKDGSIVGAGYHKKAGLPHAEVSALESAGRKSKGATLYVTLEPCDHFGRTPPCTRAIIACGITHVVIGMKDPNPLNNGAGIRRLKAAGIRTTVGVLRRETEAINKPYIKYITKRMPFVTIKTAQSLDGKIATRSGDSKWISGEDSRRYVQDLRSRSDAVMIGANTLRKDDPLLLSAAPRARQPARVIVDGVSGIRADASIFSTADRSPVMLASSVLGRKGKADLPRLMAELARRGIVNILVEGGGELAASLIEKGLADRLLIFVAPKVIGGRSAVTSVEGDGVARIKDARDFSITNITRFKKDILIEAEKGCSPA